MRVIILFLCVISLSQSSAQFPRLLTSGGHQSEVLKVKFYPDNKAILSSDQSQKGIVWDVRSGKEIFSFNFKNDEREDEYALPLLSPDGKYICTGDKIIDAHTGKTHFTINNDEILFFSNISCFSKDSKKLFIGTETGKVLVLNIEQKSIEIQKKFSAGAQAATVKQLISANRDSDLLINYETDGKETLLLCDQQLTIKKTIIRDTAAEIYDIACSRNGEYTAVAYKGRNVVVYVSGNYKPIKKFSNEYFEYYRLRFNPQPIADSVQYNFLFVSGGGDEWSFTSDNGWYDFPEYKIYGKFAFRSTGEEVALASGNYITAFKLFHDNSEQRSIGLNNAGFKDGADDFVKIEKRYDGHKSNITDIQYSPDGRYIVTASFDHTVKLWNTKNGNLICTFGAKSNPEGYYFFKDDNGDGIRFQVGQNIYFFDAHTAKIHFKSTGNTRINLEDSATWPEPYKFKDAINKNKSLELSAKDGKLFLKNNISKTTLRLDNPMTFTVLNRVAFSQNNSFLFVYSDILGGCGIVYDAKTGRKVSEICTGENAISYAAFISGKSAIITGNSASGNIKMWGFTGGSFLAEVVPIQFPVFDEVITYFDGYKFINLDEGTKTAFLSTEKNGYYSMQFSGEKYLHFILENGAIAGFEQLDLKYNRPDKVLEAIGCNDMALINAYQQAYYKRIEKLGVDTTYFNNDYTVPEADFQNRDNIEGDQANANLRLLLNASDKSTNLDRYNLWVNEVPLYGQKGKSLRDKQTKELKVLPVEVELTPGRNKIEFSVFNTSGIESYRQPLFVNYNPSVPPPSEKVYFIGIGINRFASNTNALNWCVSDIRDLTTTLQQKLGSQFVMLDTLFDQRVTLQNIQKLKEKLLKTAINDKVIIAYSGHGLLSKKYDYYLSGYNVDFKSPENGGIPYEALEGLLDSIPARKKLLLLDACNSGEVDKGSGGTIAGGIGTKGIGDSVEVVGVDKTKLGLANSFELMRELFVNVNKGTGATVIAAAQGYQSALEQNKLGHGVFTYSILEALKSKSTMKISELKKWVSENVVKLTDGKQQPTTRIEPIDVDWSVW